MYINRHPRIDEYKFKLLFPITITEEIEASHVVTGINNLGIVYTSDEDLFMSSINTVDLQYLLSILEKGEYKL